MSGSAYAALKRYVLDRDTGHMMPHPLGAWAKSAEVQAAIEALEAELAITERLLKEAQRVVRAIPACELHGDLCVPSALAWVESAKDQLGAEPADTLSHPQEAP